MTINQQMPEWLAPLLWTCTAGALVVGALLVGYLMFKGERSLSVAPEQESASGTSPQSSPAAPSDGRYRPEPEVLARHQDSSELVGAPTDPNDLALLRLLKGANFGDGGRIVLPSGRSITSQQARELTQDS